MTPPLPAPVPDPPARLPKPRGRAAFSLIEVVLALALFAMAATVLTSSFVNALLAREHGQNTDRFHDDLREVRRQLLLEPNVDDAEDGDRHTTLHHGEAIWRARIEPTRVVDLFRAELVVEFLDPPEGRPAVHRETLHLLRPTWSESDERSELLDEKKRKLENQRDFRSF